MLEGRLVLSPTQLVTQNQRVWRMNCWSLVIFTDLGSLTVQTVATSRDHTRRANRSSRSQMFYKKVVLKNVEKLTRKQLCRSLFLNRVAGLQPESLWKKRFCQKCFLVRSSIFFRIAFCWTPNARLVLKRYNIPSYVHRCWRSLISSNISKYGDKNLDIL